MFEKELKSASGRLTLAHIDCPDDIWRVAIVKGYRDPQDYDEILCTLGTSGEWDCFGLTIEQAQKVLDALDT
jgi:hypothetical protein